jgi:hypothetical protein
MASKRAKRRKDCGGKVQYSSQTRAVGALIVINKREASGMHSYKCPFGNHWHLGHAPKRVRQAIRDKSKNSFQWP